MGNLSKTALAAAIITTFTAAPVMAYEAGDFIARVGPAGVFPTGESDDLDAVTGGQVEADDAWSLGLSFSYMFTDKIGVGVLGAWPFEHDIQPKGNLKAVTGSGDVGETKHLPPTVTLQWHIPTGTSFNPYLGAGINYTYFFDEDTKGTLGDTGADLDIDDSWGWAAEAGVDYLFPNDWLVSAQVWYISIEPDADVTGGTLGLNEDLEVEINPWVFMASFGKKF
jgi:outer membrane protein